LLGRGQLGAGEFLGDFFVVAGKAAGKAVKIIVIRSKRIDSVLSNYDYGVLWFNAAALII
jgi:hypothetical protein